MRPGFVAPTVAAKMSNTLDQLTQGRVLINVVTGGFPAELAADGDFTDHDERYDRTQEFMQVVRKAWTEPKRWDHEGKYYKVEGGNVFPKPYQQPYPPFYFGGASDAAKKVGAEETDVYLLWGEPLAMVRERIAEMRDLRRCRRAHPSFRPAHPRRRRGRPKKRRGPPPTQLIADIPENFQQMMEKHKTKVDSEGERRQIQLREAKGEDLVLGPNLWAGIGKARLGVGTALVGSGENVARRLQEYIDEGIDTFILSGYPHLEEAQRFGNYVMPHFAGKRSRSRRTRGLTRSCRVHRSIRPTPAGAECGAHEETKPPLAVAISGSPRSPSRSKTLAELVLTLLAELGYETRIIDLASLPADALLARAQSPEIDDAIYAVGQARVAIASTPTYRGLYTGLLKCFFDLMPQAHLAGKLCIGLQTGIAREHALSPEYGLRPLFASLDGVAAAVLYARDDEFIDGEPTPELCEKVTKLVSESTGD